MLCLLLVLDLVLRLLDRERVRRELAEVATSPSFGVFLIRPFGRAWSKHSCTPFSQAVPTRSQPTKLHL